MRAAAGAAAFGHEVDLLGPLRSRAFYASFEPQSGNSLSSAGKPSQEVAGIDAIDSITEAR